MLGRHTPAHAGADPNRQVGGRQNAFQGQKSRRRTLDYEWFGKNIIDNGLIFE
jgi:hypothetical protein